MNWYLRAIQHYADFKGRASRQEYWMFMIINAVIFAVLTFIGAYIGHKLEVQAVYGLFILIPGIALSVRRLHDTNRSGWFLLLGLLPIIGQLIVLFFKIQKGNEMPNRFGVTPY